MPIELVNMNMNKLVNFPTVHYITLYENIDRNNFMIEQLTKYGIPYQMHPNHRYTTFQDSVNIIWPHGPDTAKLEDFKVFSHPGTIISYLIAMKHWYDNTHEEHAIFCDDDMSFESIDHWNFTWQEFVHGLPCDWECVQLVRINNWNHGLINNHKIEIPSLKLRTREWDDYGGAALFKRAYVKKILDRHWIDSKSFNFQIQLNDFFYYATIENLLFINLTHAVYNVPMLLEKPFPTTLDIPQLTYCHWKSYEYYSTLWKLYGTDLPFGYFMNHT